MSPPTGSPRSQPRCPGSTPTTHCPTTPAALCDLLADVWPALTGAAAAGVDVLLTDDDTRVGEALVLLHDVRRALDSPPATLPPRRAGTAPSGR